MKQIFFGALVFLAGWVLTYWLMSAPELEQALELAVPSQQESRPSPAPGTGLGGSESNQIADNRSIFDRGESDSDIEPASEVDSAVGQTAVPDADLVPLLPGIELSGNVQVLHAMLEEEVREELWAAPMEQELYNYFFDKSPQLADNFGVPNVVCRSTICEVQTIGYGQGSLEAWQAATSDLDSQPWADQFIQVQMTGNQIGPDVGGLVLVLIRASGDATVQSIGDSVAII